MAGQPEKVAGRPPIPAATQFLTRVLLNSVSPSLKSPSSMIHSIHLSFASEMEAFLVENLTAWIASLDGSEKLNFRGFGLNALFTLSRTPLHLPFLHAAARFWNPVTHVFRFGGQEVCPTFEDFQV